MVTTKKYSSEKGRKHNLNKLIIILFYHSVLLCFGSDNFWERKKKYNIKIDGSFTRYVYFRYGTIYIYTDKVLGIKHTNFQNISNLTLHQFCRMAHISCVYMSGVC